MRQQTTTALMYCEGMEEVLGMELMRAKEVAKLLNVSTRTVYELAEKWNLPHIRLNGRTIRFELEGIQTFLKRRRRAN